MKRRRSLSEIARSPAFDRIDRRIAAAFLVVTTALMAVVFILGSALYIGAVRAERERLSGVVADVLGPSLEGLKAAGEYKLQRLAETLQGTTPTLAYIRVVERDGVELVHAGRRDAEVSAADADVVSRLGAADKHFHLVRGLSLDGRPVTEVAMTLQAGYRGEWSGVLRVGIWGETPAALLLDAGVIVGSVVAVLLAFAFPVVLWLGRRLGAPVQALAQDFEGVMRHAPLHITIEDATGHIQQSSAAFQQAFALPPDAHPAAAAVFPEDVLAAGVGERPEVRMTVGGEERVFLTSRFPVALSEAGEVLRAGVISTDVTAWRRDQAQRDQMVAAVESTGDQILVATAIDGVVFANPAFYRQTGFAAADVLGQDAVALLTGPKDDARKTDPARDALTGAVGAGGSWQGRIAARRRDGSTFPCDLSVFPILDDAGAVRAQVWSARDVSRQAELEAQLLQAQRMEAIGRLAGGVAHDFNNLLTVINGTAELLLTDPLDEAQLGAVHMIAEAGRRAAGLTRQLLAFGRRQALDIQRVDLNTVIGGSLELLRSALGGRVALSFEPCEDLWATRGDVGQIEQALMNLAINARDAMPGQGALRIATENAELTGVSEADGANVPDGDYVVLTVADTGLGMEPGVLEHIFEPFFTTKEVGKGTGLGLAMVHGVVRQSGGHLWVFSQPGVGTTFRIAFPRVAASAATTPTRRATLSVATAEAREHVLVVDDDEAVRVVMARMLRQGGYRVSTARDGAEALAMLDGAGAVLADLVLTDLVMPGMSGTELATALGEQWPLLPVLFMSGYSAQAAGLTGSRERAGLIQKPASASVVLTAVRGALDAAATLRGPRAAASG